MVFTTSLAVVTEFVAGHFLDRHAQTLVHVLGCRACEHSWRRVCIAARRIGVEHGVEDGCRLGLAAWTL